MDSSRPFSSGKPRHAFLDLFTAGISEEDKHKMANQYHEKETLLDPSLLETYLSGQPLLLSLSLLLAFVALALFCIAVLVTACRFLGRCGGRRYQPHPSSSRRFLVLLLSFLLAWLLLASASLNFILSGASFWGQRDPTQLVTVPIKTSIDYPDYDGRAKRESILASLFNDPDYNGDFENIDDREERSTTTTTETAFVVETTRAELPIRGDKQSTVESTVVVGTVYRTRNGEIAETGTRPFELTEPVNEEEEEEEYIEGDEGEDEEEEEEEPTTTRQPKRVKGKPQPSRDINSQHSPITEANTRERMDDGPRANHDLRRLFLSSTSPASPFASRERPPIQSKPARTHFTSGERIPFGGPDTTTGHPRWVERIGKGDEWDEVLRRGGEDTDRDTVGENSRSTVAPTTTVRRRIVTTTVAPTTTDEQTTVSTDEREWEEEESVEEREPDTTRAPSTTSTTATTTTTTSTPPTTTRRRLKTTTTVSTTVLSTASTTVTSSTVPSTTELALPPLTAPVPIPFRPLGASTIHLIDETHPDYVSISGVGEEVPLQIGHFGRKGTMQKKNGHAAVSLMTHRRKFDSLHSAGFRSMERAFTLVIGFLLSLLTLPSLLLVVLGAMHYARSYHPMDRSRLSDRVGVMCVILSLCLLFLVPLLLLHADIGLVLSHTHHTLCPILQPPAETVDEIVMGIEGCARVATPVLRMWQSSLLAALAALPVSVLLLQLSNYFLRMRTEHYWTQSEFNLF